MSAILADVKSSQFYLIQPNITMCAALYQRGWWRVSEFSCVCSADLLQQFAFDFLSLDCLLLWGQKGPYRMAEFNLGKHVWKG